MKTKNRALFAAITVFTCIFMILSNAVAIIKDVAISKTFSETDFTHALLALVYLALAIAVGTNSRKAFPVVCLAIPIALSIYSFSELYSQTSMSLSFTTIYSFLVSISAYLVPMLILIFENCQKSGKAKRYFRFIVWLPVVSTIVGTIKVKESINGYLKEAIKWANNPDYILYVVNHALLFISAVLFPIFVYFLCAWALSGTSMFAAFDFRKEAAPETASAKGCRSIRVNHAWGAEIVTAIIALIAILLYLFPGSAPLYSLFKLGLLIVIVLAVICAVEKKKSVAVADGKITVTNRNGFAEEIPVDEIVYVRKIPFFGFVIIQTKMARWTFGWLKNYEAIYYSLMELAPEGKSFSYDGYSGYAYYGFFSEKSGHWIRIYKLITLIVAALCVIAGVALGVRDFFSKAIIGDFGLLLWTLAGIVSGFIILVPNMLIIQLLNNIQTMREKSDKE